MEIVAEALHKRFGPKQTIPAVDDVSFRVDDGELLVLLGPSGCGKTTTLRCLAGLEQPDRGSIRFGDNTVFDRSMRRNVAVHHRDVGFVFQSFALWPHLSARDNIRFPLRSRHVRAAAQEKMVNEVAELLDLRPDLLRKPPGQLSGGQQQRVALARALVAEPGVVLFDEPLSSLDARLREQLRSDLRALHRRVGFTGVYVTHDLTEALTIGDRVAVMGGGKIVQIGAPLDVFDRPVDASTAGLLGLRRICTVTPAADGTWSAGADVTIEGTVPDIRSTAGDLTMYIRPDRAYLSTAGTVREGRIVIKGGRVISSIALGTHSEVTIALGTEQPRLQIAAVGPLTAGDRIDLEVEPADVRFYTEAGDLWAAP